MKTAGAKTTEVKEAGRSSAVKTTEKPSSLRAENNGFEQRMQEGVRVVTRGAVRAGTRAAARVQGRAAASFACEHFDAEMVWKSMLESNDERIRLAAAKYLTDRLYGRAGQAVKLPVEVEHKITVVVDL